MMRPGWTRGPWLVALLISSLAVPEATVEAGAHARSGNRGGRAPRNAAPRRQNMASAARASKMSHPSAASANSARSARATSASLAANANLATRPLAATSAGNSIGRANSYTYGTGNSARRYPANGYGQGYRNRSSGGRYGRSQGNNRAIASRLRSVHSNLGRLDHDYRGHRVKAMHSISMAVRQLSHGSGRRPSNGVNLASMNQGRNLGANRANANNAGGRGNARLTQAQADGRMSQALRTTQGIHMQMNNQGSSSRGTRQAGAHVARAVRELNTALAIR